MVQWLKQRKVKVDLGDVDLTVETGVLTLPLVSGEKGGKENRTRGTLV